MEIIVGSPECNYERIVEVLLRHSVKKEVDFRSLARQLDTDDEEIEKLVDHEVIIDDACERQLCIDILSLWVLRNSSGATLAKLLSHLGNLKWETAADQLRKDFAGTEKKYPRMDSLPVVPKYYVPRVLQTRNRLSTEIFAPHCEDIKVFTGIERHRLTELARGQLTDSSRSQVYRKQISVRFIILEQKGDWDKLCEKTHKPIHLIHCENGRYIWVRSKGDMYALQDAILDSDQVRLTEEAFVEEVERVNPFRVNQPLCIVDSPGMGKSMLLAKLGRRLQIMFSNRYVIFIPMAEFISEVHSARIYDKEETVLKVTATRLGITFTELSSEIGLLPAKSETKFELMFDGLDEVQSKHLPLVYDCLEILINAYGNCARLWISSRPHLFLELENRLNVLSYNIQPFSESDQLSFLTSYWSSEKVGLDTEELFNFAKECVSLIPSEMGNRNKDIFGIPLQCMLVGEVFAEEAYEHADPENIIFSESEVKISSPGFRAASIADLFEGMINRNFLKGLKASSKPNHTNKTIWLTHVYHGLKLIFDDEAQDFLKLLENKIIGEEEEIVNAGLLQFVGEPRKARFLHRSFAEYFVAWYFVEQLDKECTSKHVPFLFKYIFRTREKEFLILHEFPEILWYFEEETICYFFDTILLQKLGTILPDVDGDYQPEEETLSRVLMACCYSDHVSILKLLHLQNFIQAYPNSHFNETFLVVLTTYSSVDMMQFLFYWHPSLPLLNIQRISSADDKTILHVAACQGRFAEFEYLLKFHDFEEMITRQDNSMSDLVHYCVMETDKVHENKVRGHIQILNVLLTLDAELLEAKTNLHETPLLRRDLHFLALLELVKLGANILATDIVGRNFLHNSFNAITHQESDNPYRKLFDCIGREKLAELVQMRTQWGATILHSPSIISDADEETLRIIYECGADLNLRDDRGVSVLGGAIENINRMDGKIRGDAITRILRTLVNLGADCFAETQRGNALHLAAGNGNKAAAVYLVTELGMDVNVLDRQHRTPLYHAISGSMIGSGRVKVGKFLRKHGGILKEPVDKSVLLFDRISKLDMLGVELILGEADVNPNDTWEDGMTPMHFVLDISGEDHVASDAYEWARLEIVRMLLESGADVNAQNLQNETSLLYFLRTRPEALTLSLLRFMTSHGALCSSKISNATLFWLGQKSMSEDDFEEMIEILLINGAEIESLDENENSLLHFAAKWKYTTRLKFLLEKYSLPINVQNRKGDTPLHEALRFPENINIDNLRMFEDEVQRWEKERLETILVLLEYGADVNLLNENHETPLSSYWTTFNVAKSDFDRKPFGYNSRELFTTSNQDNTEHYRDRMRNQILEGIPSTFPADFKSPSEDFEMQSAATYIELLKIFLLEKKFKNIRLCDDSTGDTLLHKFFVCCSLTPQQFQSLVELLVDANCVDIFNICGGHQVTPLHIALRKFEVDCETVELLHSNGVDFDILDENGMSAFWYCIHSKNKPSVIQHLQKYCNWRALNIHGRNVLHDAVLCRDASTIHILDTDKALQYSIDNGGLTPLHMALQRQIDQDSDEEVNEKLELIKHLMKENPYLCELDGNGHSIAHHAACFLEPPLFQEFNEILVESGCADALKMKGAGILSVLHYAVSLHEIQLETLQLFANQGFDFSEKCEDKNSLLLCAVKGGRNLAFLKQLSDFGVSWDDPENTTRILHELAFQGNVECLRHLLSELSISADSYVNAADENGDTLLHWAMKNDIRRTRDAIMLLLEQGANPNATNHAGDPPLFTALKSRAWMNKDTPLGSGIADISEPLMIIKTLLDFDLDIRAKDSGGYNFIHCFIMSSQFTGMNTFKILGNFLVENSCTDLLNEQAGPLQQTPIHLMIRKPCEIETLHLLHKNGVNFDIPDVHGWVALHYVVFNKMFTSILETLTSLSDWKVVDNHKNNIMHHASLHGSVAALCHFLQLDTSNKLVCARNADDATPLHLATLRKSEKDHDLCETSEVILTVLPFYEEEINCQDKQGNTIISCAVQGKRNVSILRQLVKYGANWKIPNNHNSTVLHHAASGGHILALRYFSLESGGCADIFNEADGDGDTPLHCAVIDAKENVLDMVRILVQNGVNVDIKNKTGETPLTAALLRNENGMEPEVIILLEKKD